MRARARARAREYYFVRGPDRPCLVVDTVNSRRVSGGARSPTSPRNVPSVVFFASGADCPTHTVVASRHKTDGATTVRGQSGSLQGCAAGVHCPVITAIKTVTDRRGPFSVTDASVLPRPSYDDGDYRPVFR